MADIRTIRQERYYTSNDNRDRSSMWKKIWVEYKRERRFETDEMEKLFQRYVLQANKIHLTHLLGLLIATLVVMFLGLVLIFLLSPTTAGGGKDGGKNSRKNEIVTVLSVLLAIVIFCVSLAGVVFRKKTNEGFLLYISYALTATFMVLEMTLTRNAANLWATAFFVYITYSLLPIRLLEATISGICLSIVHIPPYQNQMALPSYNKQGVDDKLVNLLLLLSVNIVGILTHFPADMAKRKAFYEIRQYVRAKITIQKETVRQQRLLMSVLPEHLIEEMKADLAQEGGSISKRKIYMKTYEPVSILFADIVGFTSLADRSAAKFVVELLNELYCGFDKLARKNRCMRIKLLGDCYYCVCGLPKPSAFHASHCVNMGLDMIYAMQGIREKFKVEVDIRVGVHTGKLQCGVLGLKKWQFDIWSSDVELANFMESGGMPGKVHISAATKNSLKAMIDSYTIEPAFGSSREPALKDIETFFVTPSNQGKVKIRNRVSMHSSGDPNKTGQSMDTDHAVPLFNPVKRERDIERELIATLYNSINSRSIRRLKKTNCKSTVLRFKDYKMERRYNQEPDRMLQSYFIAALVIYLAMTIVQLIVMPGTPTLMICTAIGFCWITLACSLVMAWKYKGKRCCPRCITGMSSKIDRSRNLAQVLALTTVLLSYITIAIPMVSEESYICRSRPDIKDAEARSLTPIGPIHENPLNDTCAAKTLPYPEHTLLYTILIMIMTGAFQIVMFMFKFLIMLVLCSSYAVLLITAPYFMKSVVVAEAAIKYFLMIMALASFLLLMLIQSQQSEIVHRLDFVWKMNARSDTENAQQLQKFNQKLIENILPAHVAKHYLEKERPSDELYHEECASACILFACVTNFSFADVDGVDSEHNVAILHDIISDIDELLNDPIFESIEKIKSTGAIYMAASGLSLKKESSNTHEHVIAMAYFALTLRSHIQLINFRHATSFGVKIGICMGPVVAGVIGASMPQYDIWGNTVNVASRMYSTGLENHIQITENVAVAVGKNGFTVRERGTVYVKGKGSMVTFFLNSGPSHEEIYRRNEHLLSPQRDGRGSVGRGRQSRLGADTRVSILNDVLNSLPGSSRASEDRSRRSDVRRSVTSESTSRTASRTSRTDSRTASRTAGRKDSRTASRTDSRTASRKDSRTASRNSRKSTTSNGSRKRSAAPRKTTTPSRRRTSTASQTSGSSSERYSKDRSPSPTSAPPPSPATGASTPRSSGTPTRLSALQTPPQSRAGSVIPGRQSPDLSPRRSSSHAADDHDTPRLSIFSWLWNHLWRNSHRE